MRVPRLVACPAPVAPLPPRGSLQSGPFSMLIDTRSPDAHGHAVLSDCLIARRQYVRARPRCGDEMQHSASPDRHLRGLSQPLATPAAPNVAPVTGSANVP